MWFSSSTATMTCCTNWCNELTKNSTKLDRIGPKILASYSRHWKTEQTMSTPIFTLTLQRTVVIATTLAYFISDISTKIAIFDFLCVFIKLRGALEKFILNSTMWTDCKKEKSNYLLRIVASLRIHR